MTENRFGNKIIYQLELRTFTPEGTLNAAAKMLEHIKETGFDIVYLCPVCRSDEDPDRDFWSERQKKSGAENPKNSYRICDYYNVDEEYGTNDDLKNFIKKAHSVGLFVLLDLVYFHCGPNSVFIDSEPEFVNRDENGEIIIGMWKFPTLNFKSEKLREYLWRNMEYYVRDFDVDGYRCDVGQLIPDDFWLEGVKRIKQIKPEVIMLNEGYVVDITAGENENYAFDTNYNFMWKDVFTAVFNGEANAYDLRRQWYADRDYYRGLIGKTVRAFDNHDVATDTYEDRWEKVWGRTGVECALALNHTIDGIPFIFNGYEIASDCRANMFSNRFSKGVNAIDWQYALTKEGKERLEFMKKLNALHHESKPIVYGELEFAESNAPDLIFAFERKFEGKTLTFVANVSARPVRCEVNAYFGKEFIKKGIDCEIKDGKLVGSFEPFGYAIYTD